MNRGNDPRILEARRLILEVIDEHDETCREEGCQYAVNLAAWIAHSVGAKSKASIGAMLQWLEKYNIECPGCTNRN